MAEQCVINIDLAAIYDQQDEKKFLDYLSFGDAVEVTSRGESRLHVVATLMQEQSDGSVVPKAIPGVIKAARLNGREVAIPIDQSKVLKVNFVDVQQGDGSVVETPRGKVMLIDGGDNQLFARYLAGRYRSTTKEHPKVVDCIVISHGDADHFMGLTRIKESETLKRLPPYKRLFIKPLRVFHNGILKGPSSHHGDDVPETELLGPTTTVGNDLYLTELADSITGTPAARLNTAFKKWKQVLEEYQQDYGPIQQQHLSQGNNAAFSFMSAGEPVAIDIEVLGPVPTQVNGQEALPFLREPAKDRRTERPPGQPGAVPLGGYSASQTINGHSVVFRMTYGRFTYLFAGDLNAQSEASLLGTCEAKLSADVLKVPHHGSADFSTDFIKAVCPLISVISSGDENEQKEYIHPRATLVGALGKYSRLDRPLIFITELAAFFATRGFIDHTYHKMTGTPVPHGLPVVDLNQPKNKRFFSFSRSAFGIVKTRTDGQRLLVYTDSGNVKLKEAYAFEYDAVGALQEVDLLKV